MSKAIENRLKEQAEDLKKNKDFWKVHKALLKPVIKALEAKEIEPWIANGWFYISFSGDKHKLADVVRVLRTNGFSTTSDKPEPNSTSWYALYKNPSMSGYVCLNFSSSVCQRVQVGTKMEEVPVYEVRCGDATNEIEV